MIIFRKARPEEAFAICKLRQQIWSTTYRGIYDDAMIDDFDFPRHIAMTLAQIKSSTHHVELILDNAVPIGYLIFNEEKPPKYKSFPLRLGSLYILKEYQRHGVGKMAFDRIRNYCIQHNYDSFYNECQPENTSAIAFYRRMGGVIGQSELGSSCAWENSIWFEYRL